MDESLRYLAISIIILAAVALLLFIAGRKKPREDLSGLVALSLALITAGMVFGENRLVGYSLIGAGILLAAIDISLRMVTPMNVEEDNLIVDATILERTGDQSIRR